MSSRRTKKDPTLLMSLRNDDGAFDWRRLGTLEFWRNAVVHFCLCSVVGRWLEIPWCLFCLHAFNIYDPNSLVWKDPFYPFCVYGVGALVCGVLLTPMMDRLLSRRKTALGAVAEFYLVCVFACMLMEIGMGLLLNQPDAAGNYPLWDNARLPLNVLGQAWIPNDLALGAVALIYTWVFYPLVEIVMGAVPRRAMNIAATVIAVAFVALCIWEFGFVQPS